MGRLTLLGLLRSQWSPIQPVVTANLAGKTVVITGSNTGLGFEAAKHFAKMNPGRLILACRSQEKGEVALGKLRTETGYDQGEVWLVDQADFSSVKSFADKFEEEGGRLDYLILNAGVASPGHFLTNDGWELRLQVNSLSTSLLALLLLPRMIETARTHSVVPRLVVVSSGAHYWSTFDQQVRESPEPLKTLGSKECRTDQASFDRYCDTKLLNVLFVRALANRLANIPVIVDAIDPGYSHSELDRHAQGFTGMIVYLVKLLFAMSAEQGSRQLVWGALGGKED
ncbi:hypothetical protein F5887DRAFT_422881 [Amanita rubescens]|nr:hypothetical protein F5887DRAFT_422881 [Amanita rubescens]